MKVDVYNLSKQKVGELELADDVWGAEVNEALFYDVVRSQLASRRAGTHRAKTRSAVSGSTKKLYKQKGTGRARHGSLRAPTYVGGGKAHGPVPRDYSYRPNRKMRIGALRSALSMMAKEGRLVIVDRFELGAVKTKGLVGVLKALSVDSGSVLVDGKGNDNLRLSARNLPDHLFLPPEGVNVYDLLRHPNLVLTTDAAKALEARCQA
ncbi:MAG: 50S ribosomal protein L4 [Deltaproteobacteria bacterium]|nr:50S ribosomal protein L4 [Deltaproteobacteria bacterium]